MGIQPSRLLFSVVVVLLLVNLSLLLSDQIIAGN